MLYAATTSSGNPAFGTDAGKSRWVRFSDIDLVFRAVDEPLASCMSVYVFENDSWCVGFA